MAVASTTIRVNGRDADLARGTVSDGRNAAVALRPQSLAILKLLVAKPGVLVSKDEIMSAVWPNIAVTDDSLVQCVTEIRKALGDDRHAVIKTVPKRGYVFESGAQENTSLAAKSWTAFAAATAVALAIVGVYCGTIARHLDRFSASRSRFCLLKISVTIRNRCFSATALQKIC